MVPRTVGPAGTAVVACGCHLGGVMSDRPPLPFADQPRSELDRAMRELMERADAMIHTQGRLQALLRATQAMVEHVELPVVLERIAQAAVELVDAEFGALGVIAADGNGLEAFIHVGMSDADAVAIGHLPEGRGVLGALIDDPNPIRLRHISDHPRSVGFPRNHPRMDAFLGVPIRVRNEVFGNLYLSNPRRGEFIPEDEQLVTALAATAGFVIANARLLEETQLRQRWMASSAQITAALLDSVEGSPLGMLAEELVSRTTVDRVCVAVPGDDGEMVRIAEARGFGAADLAGAMLNASETEAYAALASGTIRARIGLSHDPQPDALAIRDETLGTGAVMFLPLTTDGAAWGVLAVAREPGRPPFSSAETEIAADLAGRVALALELARAREQHQHALLVQDRARIARDLHDHVIQQLFGTGLELQAVAESVDDAHLSERIRKSVATLDDAILQIRTSIFAMTPRPERDESLRHRILDIAGECSTGRSRPVSVSFEGPVDLMVHGRLADDVAAAAREMIMNAVKHAEANVISAAVTTTDSEVQITVSDDGVGMTGTSRGNGITNLAARATARGGTFDIVSEPGRTDASWIVPLEGIAE